MPKLSQLLARQFSLMVSLPKNQPELALAAVEAGAQTLKVHLNCHHFASGTSFGSWDQEKAVLKEILASVKVPVGIVTGEETQPSQADWEEIQGAGFDFWDLFARFTPPRYFELEMGRMVAVDSSFTETLMGDLSALGVQVIEGSVIPRSDYGTPLSLVDLATYRRLIRACAMPVMIPSQKKLLPGDLRWLRQVGAAGVTIGAIVTGLELSSLKEATAAFAEALRGLPGGPGH